MKLSREIIALLNKQGLVIVSSIDEHGYIHSSAKGVGGVKEGGSIFLIDLFLARTYRNLINNPIVTITFFDEHEFTGYALQGKAIIVEKDKIDAAILSEWEEKVVQRISKRLIRNLKKGKSTSHHPEAAFPHPQYIIEVDVDKIIDLAPEQLKKPAK